jgi:hypothetical protein
MVRLPLTPRLLERAGHLRIALESEPDELVPDRAETGEVNLEIELGVVERTEQETSVERGRAVCFGMPRLHDQTVAGQRELPSHIVIIDALVRKAE